jgi:hypothetical protein
MRRSAGSHQATVKWPPQGEAAKSKLADAQRISQGNRPDWLSGRDVHATVLRGSAIQVLRRTAALLSPNDANVADPPPN